METNPTQMVPELGANKREFASQMFKMLGHPLRLHIVEVLDVHGQLTVNEIAAKVSTPQPTVSLYLNRLKDLGILGSRRVANQSFYFIDHPKIHTLLECIRECPLEE